jgi:hypothetical protein
MIFFIHSLMLPLYSRFAPVLLPVVVSLETRINTGFLVFAPVAPAGFAI